MPEHLASVMGRVLTDWRKRLQTSVLSDLLLISMERSEDTGEFDGEAAVKLWLIDI